MGASGAPLWQGTMVFALIWLGLGVLGTAVGAAGKLWTRRETSLVWFLAFMMCFCMWLMWACMWLMQWNPIIVPLVAPEGGESHKLI